MGEVVLVISSGSKLCCAMARLLESGRSPWTARSSFKSC